MATRRDARGLDPILVERLDRGRWGAAAWGVALVCLAEQTSTSPTFEVSESRARIAEVARRIAAITPPSRSTRSPAYIRATDDPESWSSVSIRVLSRSPRTLNATHIETPWAARKVATPRMWSSTHDR